MEQNYENVLEISAEKTETETDVQPNKKESLGKRIDAFLDRNYALVFAPILVLVLYMAALFQQGVYPFGTKYTAASYDLSAQICPFIEHLFDVFDGKSALTYTYAIVGGVDVTGTFLYFFVSPFSFLFLILGDGMVAHASSIVMACKLMTISVSGVWFAKKLFQGIPEYVCVGVGIIYAYCGYMFVANTYINWMDFLIYLPFCAGAFKHFVKTGKFLAFAVLVACCIYTCFSIACFSMFIAFPTLILYGLLCVEKNKRNKFLCDLCLSFVAAILFALPILLPALAAFLNSARVGKLFENLWYGFTVAKGTGDPSNFNSSTFIDRYSESMYRKWSYILSDTVFVALTIAWFFRKGLKDPFAKFMLAAGILTSIPNVVDEAMQLMNMGSYMSYALRFGFLNALYFLGGACLALEGICYKRLCAYDGTPLLSNAALAPLENNEKVSPLAESTENTAENVNGEGRYALTEEISKTLEENDCPLSRERKKKIYLFAGLFLVIGVLIGAFLLWFTSNDNYTKFLSLFTNDSEMIESFDGIPARYAHSLGGMEAIVVLFACVGILTAVGCCLVGAKKISPRFLAIVLMIVVAVQVSFYNSLLVVGNSSTQHKALGNYERLCEQLNKIDDGYFRVKDYNDKLTANAPFTGGCNSFSVFSSVIDKDNFAAFELFGYKGNGKNSFKSSHNTDKSNRSDEFGDSFLGYKYYFVPKSKMESFKSGSLSKYVKPFMVTDENGEEKHLSDGDYYIYENEIVFPLGYTLPSGEFRFDRPNQANATYRMYNQQALYKFLRGEKLSDMKGETGSSSSKYVTPESARELSEYLWSKAADVEVGAGEITAKVSAKAGECLFLNFVASDGYTVTVNGKKAELIENDLKFLSVKLEEGENVVKFTYSSPYVKYALLGLLGGIVAVCAAVLILKKTRWVEKLAPIIAWAGILLSVAVVAFFMLYPTAVWIVKLVNLLLL